MVQKRSEADRAPSKKSRSNDETEVVMAREEDYVYSPAAALTVPIDDDYDYRWCREWVNGTFDPTTLQRHMQDGYKRVLMDDLPEDFIMFDPTAKSPRGDDDGGTRYGGLVLMRCPKFKHEAKINYFRRQGIERLASANTLQGVAGRDAVEEDRGSRALTGEDAARALQTMNST